MKKKNQKFDEKTQKTTQKIQKELNATCNWVRLLNAQ